MSASAQLAFLELLLRKSMGSRDGGMAGGGGNGEGEEEDWTNPSELPSITTSHEGQVGEERDGGQVGEKGGMGRDGNRQV